MSQSKPSIQQVPVLDLFDAMNFLEENGHEGFKKRFWYHMNENHYLTNDSYVVYYFPNNEDEYDIELSESQSYKDEVLIKTTFELEDSILFWVSW